MTEPNTSLSDRPVYFFGQKFEYGYLSQWFNCPFAAPVTSSELALTFQTAKQYMMYRKAVLFEDFTVAKKILGTSAPKEQKKLGRQVKSFNQATWEKHREEIVEAANWNKLTNSKKGRELPEKLLATEDRLLVEVCCHGGRRTSIEFCDSGITIRQDLGDWLL